MISRGIKGALARNKFQISLDMCVARVHIFDFTSSMTFSMP